MSERCQVLTLSLLGRHVTGRTYDAAGLHSVAPPDKYLETPKSSTFQMRVCIGLVPKDIVGFHVAVDDAIVMSGCRRHTCRTSLSAER